MEEKEVFKVEPFNRVKYYTKRLEEAALELELMSNGFKATLDKISTDGIINIDELEKVKSYIERIEMKKIEIQGLTCKLAEVREDRERGLENGNV